VTVTVELATSTVCVIIATVCVTVTTLPVSDPVPGCPGVFSGIIVRPAGAVVDARAEEPAAKVAAFGGAIVRVDSGAVGDTVEILGRVNMAEDENVLLMEKEGVVAGLEDETGGGVEVAEDPLDINGNVKPPPPLDVTCVGFEAGMVTVTVD